MTGEKIFTPRRVPQGCSDAAIYFQKTMESSFASLLYKHLLVWIDNLLLYADGIDIYLDKLAELFSLLNDFSLKLMRTVGAATIVCAINWMRGSIVDYARRVSPLQHKLDEALVSTRCTKRAAAGISIKLSAAEKAAFANVKDMLAAAATLDLLDDTVTTC
ncbi:hypothetical protein PC110_g13578 [Phytophthora cactorum]|nr:hypothetical protein PC110_g13578 [Phytophthora cactorum]